MGEDTHKRVESARRLLREDAYVKEQFVALQNKLASLRSFAKSTPKIVTLDKEVTHEVKEIIDHILKNINHPKPAAKKQSSSRFQISTDLDRILSIVASREKISLGNIAKELGVSQKIVEKWARILDKYGLATLVYPKLPLLPPYLRITKAYHERNSA
ncbi:hypothetical protein COT72_05635 [archaeon CG10_big_fil_rev_8_21_14_0_10_43_11]|nr:MAG: hypothetical protein COT72_05635 [archaeon CG10_big_fil_rev_8_21_14_0_10_43_11]